MVIVMNNKGFTLIELLSIILLLSIVSSIGVYAISSYLESSRNRTDEVLWENIRIASQEYIDEYTSGVSSLGTLTPSISGNFSTYTANTTVKELAELNFLNVVSENDGGVDVLAVVDSKGNDISNCSVNITKEVNNNTYLVNYTVRYGSNCQSKSGQSFNF